MLRHLLSEGRDWGPHPHLAVTAVSFAVLHARDARQIFQPLKCPEPGQVNPGISPPVARLMGGRTRFVFAARFFSATTILSPFLKQRAQRAPLRGRFAAWPGEAGLLAVGRS